MDKVIHHKVKDDQRQKYAKVGDNLYEKNVCCLQIHRRYLFSTTELNVEQGIVVLYTAKDPDS